MDAVARSRGMTETVGPGESVMEVRQNESDAGPSLGA